jgi:hypothetical protein
MEFLKMLLELAKEATQAEMEIVPEEELDKGKAASTELFNSAMELILVMWIKKGIKCNSGG